MPETIRQQIFNPFYTTKPTGKGTGLGLAISYQIIAETHQGQLTCTSVAGAGSEFVIQIPAHSINQAANQAAGESRPLPQVRHQV